MGKTVLAEGVYWVGAVDWDIPASSGYTGTSYNAYLIIDDKITLVDGVKHSHQDQMWANIREIIDPEEIDYMIVNHVEPDHASSLQEMVDIIKPETIFCSSPGRETIIAHFHDESWPFQVVGKGDSISLGRRTIDFIMTRMLHWPDSMFSYLREDEILFSNDAFGQHLASDERFDDEVELDWAITGAKFFYATNLILLSAKIRKIMNTLQEMGIELKQIAPDHGVIWRTHQDAILAAYDFWCNQRTTPEVLVVYDTKWKSTDTMAKAIVQGIEEKGVTVTLCNLKQMHQGHIMERFLTASTIVLGSPTFNNSFSPPMASFLHYMTGLRPKNKLAATFGSYGWGGEAVRHMNNSLDSIKMQRIDDGLRIQYMPSPDELQTCVEYGHRIAEATMNFDRK